MAKKLARKEIVSIEELVVSNVYTQEALVNLLVKKGVLTREELLAEIQRLREEAERNAS